MTPAQIAQLCLISPLIAFAVVLVLFRQRHALAAGLVITSGVLSLASAAWLFAWGAPETIIFEARWFTIADTDLWFGVLLDGRTVLMGAIVAVITLAVQIYSLGYMADDPGKGRYFAFLALFEWAMLAFVFAPNLLQTFIFWELVGLASFLLIGFWYRQPAAVAAAKKAFIMTRIGDVGMFVGLILLFDLTGTLDIAELGTLFSIDALHAGLDSARVELVAALLFTGIIGKSAQFPLHSWLPDAMEGPTPVSALLHSATMVAAGVFLFARFFELFMAAPLTLTWVLAIATFTALLASTMAMVATDIKKVLAYSSISQLGFMLIGLASGSLVAGLFHLTTHAFFKALLFLCAGAYIHYAGSNDMAAIGRAGGAKLKATSAGLWVGGVSLAGLLVGGFLSKEAVLHAVHGHTLFLVGALVAAFLTAYYTFRMIFLVTRPGPAPADQHAGTHAAAHPGHPPTRTMVAPILTLAALALLVGLPWFGDHIAALVGLDPVHAPATEMLTALAIAGGGALLAWWDWGRAAAPRTGFIASAPALNRLFVNGWYLDKLYGAVFVGLTTAAAKLAYAIETTLLDGAGDAVATTTRVTASAVAATQSGRLQLYIGLAVVGLAAIALTLGLS
jgi:NADH-quinone oxidoreductase subunit L